MARDLPSIPVVKAKDPLMHGEPVDSLIADIRAQVRAGKDCVVVDMGDVRWLNSKGLGALMSGLTSCRNAGGDMAIARANEKVMSLLMIAQVEKIFDTYDSVEEAIAELEEWRKRMEDTGGAASGEGAGA